MRPLRDVALLVAAIAATSCATTTTVAVRAIGGAGSANSPPSQRLAEGLAQLAIGDDGLALESFRRVIAVQPDNIGALRGMAAAYESMGRFDLSRPLFERALALAPRDTVTLSALATSLSRQGDVQEEALVRAEIAGVGSLPVAPALVTVQLPRPTPPPPDPVVLAPSGLRLERMSLGEVALVTLPYQRTTWPSVAVVAQRRLVPVAAVRTAQAGRPAFVSIRLLNAARRMGLAAATRDWLRQRGWRRIAIADAPRPSALSQVIYPAGREVSGRRVAAQFGFVARSGPVGDDTILVILGHNAVSRRSPKARA